MSQSEEKKFQVTFLPHDRKINVPAGESLIRSAMQAGVHVNASCGGGGVCGKCRVLVEDGSVSGGVSDRLESEDIEKGYRLACLATVDNDVTIRIPVESSIDASALNKQVTPRRTAVIREIDFENLKEQGLFLPPVIKEYLEILPPDAQNNMPDVSRLVEELRKKSGWHKLELTLPVIRKLPAVLREDGFKVTATLVKPVRDDGKTLITNIQSGDTSDKCYGIALDIGTTTVYSQIIDLITGKCLGEYGDFNGQISYGEDVISRIIFAEKGEGLKTLQDVVVKTINNVLNKSISMAGIEKENISTISIAGNTTMTQLLLGIDPRHLRRAPYVPASTLYPPFTAADIGIDLDEQTIALVFPQISSYVGGDIVAGIMGTGMYRQEELTLFLDIGTNAELVIGNQDWLACTACSAGPAFEGGGVEFGMRAAKGAIEDFLIDPVTYEPMILTIGDERPKGICGSGLLTMAAVMFEMGIINNCGKFNRDLNTDRIRRKEKIWEYVVAWKEETQVDRDIVLTELDLENLIRAKGAIYSGCMTLLEEVGLTMDAIERIILAGGFGSYIDLEKAMTLGLLPEIDPERVTYIGNGSLLGARMSVLTNKIRQDVVEVTGKMTNFELSETPSYMNNYVAAMFIPHTEIEKFPRLKDRMEQRNK
ncbi:ASKHA domain-containing protein [Desulfosediminicola flagellatus]|uniref:ASKHA domain-containing protein n=1 Tax=Desulfosediminicola flagellatus TaxID=2569541 RepID=UPI0010AD80EA|nr:ASKHA domain-containing protein [Desulfosediminicola flagellatus]